VAWTKWNHRNRCLFPSTSSKRRWGCGVMLDLESWSSFLFSFSLSCRGLNVGFLLFWLGRYIRLYNRWSFRMLSCNLLIPPRWGKEVYGALSPFSLSFIHRCKALLCALEKKHSPMYARNILRQKVTYCN
jgi:hypothetical protein